MASRFNPVFEVRINASKSAAEIEKQMDRITSMLAQRMGIFESEFSVLFRFADEFGQVSGGTGLKSGIIYIDSAVLNATSVLNAPELARLGLRSRIQVILVHEVEEVYLLRQLGDPKLSHPLTVLEGAPTSPLIISEQAEEYLRKWAEHGPFERGMR